MAKLQTSPTCQTPKFETQRLQLIGKIVAPLESSFSTTQGMRDVMHGMSPGTFGKKGEQRRVRTTQ
jgi:hypothetical protein